MLDKKAIHWFNRLVQKFDTAHPFYGGIAKVEVDKHDRYINTAGEFVVPTEMQRKMIERRIGLNYANINYSFETTNQKIIPVHEKYGNQYYVDEHNNLLFNKCFNYVTPFNDGVAIVEDNEGCKIINEKGREIASSFGKITGYSEGWFVFLKASYNCGYINKNGEYLIHKKEKIKEIITEEPEQFINLPNSILLDKAQANEYLAHLEQVLIGKMLMANDKQKNEVDKIINLCKGRIKEVYQYEKIDTIDNTNEEEVKAYIKGELSLCQ